MCPLCDNKFIPSSGHVHCPKCRSKAAKIICPKCNDVLIKPSSECCLNCVIRNRPKKPRDDEYYMYEVMRRIRLRCRNNENINFSVDVKYLLSVWYSQNGTCSYTGIKLTLPVPVGSSGDKIRTASVDRKDSNKGYVKGNIQFVSMAINFMKNTMSHEETIELINLIKSFSHVAEYSPSNPV